MKIQIGYKWKIDVKCVPCVGFIPSESNCILFKWDTFQCELIQFIPFNLLSKAFIFFFFELLCSTQGNVRLRVKVLRVNACFSHFYREMWLNWTLAFFSTIKWNDTRLFDLLFRFFSKAWEILNRICGKSAETVSNSITPSNTSNEVIAFQLD